MRHLLRFSLLAILVLAGACSDQMTAPAVEGPGDAVAASEAFDADFAQPVALEARHLVLFKAGKSTPKGFADEVADLGGAVDLEYARFGFAVVSGLGDTGAAALAGLKGVDLVEEEAIFEMAPMTVDEPADAGDVIASPTDPTSAYFFGRQWNMMAIDAPTAWAAGRLGSPAVTVAILDTGIDYLYPDLQGRVDLSRSVSFVPDDDLYAAYYFPGRHPVTDLHYHGTHVAATAVSNGLVVAGVTSQTTLMGVKVCSFLGGCPGGSVFAGIIHAVDNGADVVNMSLGGWFFKSDYPGYVSVLNRLFNYAKQNNVTFTVSAGNESLDLDHIPNLFKTYCDATHVVCVSATAPAAAEGTYGPWTDVDAIAPYTNFGRSAISVAAPGGYDGAGKWVYSACSTSSLLIPICQTGTYIVGIYGTSMASPHVAGLAALAVEDVGSKPGRVRALLQQTADDLGQRGTDPFYGKGRINVATLTGTN